MKKVIPIIGSYMPEAPGGIRLSPRDGNSSMDAPNLTQLQFPTTMAQEHPFVSTASEGLIGICLARCYALS